jgi:hypothetical protein
MKDKTIRRKNNRNRRGAEPESVSPARKSQAVEPLGAAVNGRAQERALVRSDAARGAGGLLHRLGLRGVYGELTLAVRVSVFIAGVWFNDQLVHRLFDAEPPQVVMTMIPGIEWVMMWAILRETLSGAGINPGTRGHPTADASSGVGKR